MYTLTYTEPNIYTVIHNVHSHTSHSHKQFKVNSRSPVTVIDIGSTSRMNDEQHVQPNKQRYDNVQCVIPTEDTTRGDVVKLLASIQHAGSEYQITVYTNIELSHAKRQHVSRIYLDQDVRVKLLEYFRNIVLCQDVVGMDCSKSPQLPTYLSSYSSLYSVQCLQGLQLTFFIPHKECLAGEFVSETTIEVLDSPFHVYNITVNVLNQESLYYLAHVLPDSASDVSRYHDPCCVPLVVIYVTRKKIAALQVIDVLRKSADASKPPSICRSTWTTGSSVMQEQEIMAQVGKQEICGMKLTGGPMMSLSTILVVQQEVCDSPDGIVPISPPKDVPPNPDTIPPDILHVQKWGCVVLKTTSSCSEVLFITKLGGNNHF